jgi:hypothetical protein
MIAANDIILPPSVAYQRMSVVDTGGNGIDELICPKCKADISQEDWDFLEPWYVTIVFSHI